jgi:transcriptional regulator with XRE-family HTH domain
LEAFDPVVPPFSEKLGLVLKALSMSRGQLAAQLGVDKSIVGRWATGAVQPSAHNLSRLTGLVAGRVDGFITLD